MRKADREKFYMLVDEMKELVVLQKCSKKNRLFSYLSGNSDQKEEENSAESYL